jgi:vacuolar-type H+-ATPase subunit F/Vma7
MDLYVIGDEDTVLGFRYAGIPGRVVEGGEEAAEVLDEVYESGEEEIIIMTEQLANTIRERVNEIRFGTALPLIVEIPGPEGPSDESPALLDMIHEAVGIRF